MKKHLLLLALALSSGLTAMAETYDGIIAYVDGGSTSYLLSQMPTVTYSEGSAILTVDGQKVAQVALQDGNELKITYGTYVPTEVKGIEDEKVKSETSPSGRAVIRGGKLIIIGKNGKQYDASGKIVKL